MKKNSLLWIFVFCFGLACERTPRQHSVSPTFYHWQSTLALSEEEVAALDHLAIKQLYLRYFDLDWDANSKEVIPLAALQINRPLPPQFEVIPTVFITNRCLLQPEVVDLEELTQKIAGKIKSIHRQLGLKDFRQIQIDCDWTGRSRKDYFRLLEFLQNAFPEVLFSATIRLHQIKYPEKTGVPPVDRGMLMFYNMGDLENPQTDNSIFDWASAEPYLGRLPDYILPLDLALPIFSWGVVFRDGKMIRLINNLHLEDLEDKGRFRQIDSTWVEVTKSTYLQGHYLYRKDRLRLESVAPGKLEKAATLLREKIANDTLQLAFYHLDTTTLKHYSYGSLKKIITALAGQ